MKRIIITATLLLCLVLTSGARTVNLSDWTLSRNGQAAEYAAKVPATVAGVLSRNNFYGEDLMAGTAYYSADKSIFDDAWTFRTTFDAPHNCKEHCLLTFNGLNYYADIVLNGKKIASSDTTYGVFVRRTLTCKVSGGIEGNFSVQTWNSIVE